MDKKEFIKIVNILIDRKLKEILPEMVKKEVKKYMQSGIMPQKTNTLSPVNKKELIIRDNKNLKESVTQKKWSNNEVINNILNNTAQNLNLSSILESELYPETDVNDLYENLLKPENNDIQDNLYFNTNNMPNIKKGNNSTDTLKKEMLARGAAPEIANIMIRDYSNTLKLMEKSASKIRNKNGVN